MAQKVVTQLIDDLDGSELGPGEGETVAFGLDGASYELDLSNANAKKLRDAIALYIGSARRIGGRATTRSSTAPAARRSPRKSDVDPREVREWAQKNKIQVNARGRIPADVVVKFQEAHA